MWVIATGGRLDEADAGDETGAAAFQQSHADLQLIVQPGRGAEIDVHRAYREHQVVALSQQLLFPTAGAQPFAARALHESQVLRVIDHAAGIGVFPVDARREGEGLSHRTIPHCPPSA